MFVRNKSIIKTFLTKYKSIIHYNASSSEKVIWSESGEKSAQIKRYLKQSKQTALNKYDSNVQENRRWTFSLEVIMDRGLIF